MRLGCIWDSASSLLYSVSRLYIPSKGTLTGKHPACSPPALSLYPQRCYKLKCAFPVQALGLRGLEQRQASPALS